MSLRAATTLGCIVVAVTAGVVRARAQTAPPLDLFFAAASREERVARPALETLSRQWRDAYTAMIIDMARMLRASRVSSTDRSVRGCSVSSRPTPRP